MSVSGSARGWLSDARYRQQAFIPSDGGKMFYMSVWVIGPWANVRCTGRYDNISFRIKTTSFVHLQQLYLLFNYSSL